MSILLDALKKSEQQRQLGKAPTIHSPEDGVATDRSAARPWIPLVLMGTAAVAMAWIGWQQLREPHGLAQMESAVATAAEEGRPSEPPAAAEVVADATAEAQGEVAGSPAEPVAARRPQLIAQPSSRTPVQSFKADTGELKSVTVMPPDAMAQDGSAQRPEVSQSVRDYQAPATEPADAAPAAVAPGEEARMAAAAEPVASGEAQAPAAEDAEEAMRPITFWELPQGVRDSLPELRITVLVYAERPEDRFVLIAGQRITEKERLGDGVVLDEIRRDGAVFEYRKYRFLVEG